MSITTIKTQSAEKTFSRALGDIKRLLPQLHANVKALGERVKTILEIDRERAMKQLTEMGMAVSAILGLEKVGGNLLHEQVFINGTVSAQLAEQLRFEDQKTLVEQGVPVVTGGTPEEPETQMLKLPQINSRSARLLIDTKTHRIRSVQEQSTLRKKRLDQRSLPRYEVKDGKVVFHQREWVIGELKTIINAL